MYFVLYKLYTVSGCCNGFCLLIWLLDGVFKDFWSQVKSLIGRGGCLGEHVHGFGHLEVNSLIISYILMTNLLVLHTNVILPVVILNITFKCVCLCILGVKRLTV